MSDVERDRSYTRLAPNRIDGLVTIRTDLGSFPSSGRDLPRPWWASRRFLRRAAREVPHLTAVGVILILFVHLVLDDFSLGWLLAFLLFKSVLTARLSNAVADWQRGRC